MSWIIDSVKKVHELEQRIKEMEGQFSEFAYSTLQAVQSQLKKNWITSSQGETRYGLRIGLCVDTKDPFAEGRVRYYSPALHKKDTPLNELPWAWPISTLGGFDDSGAFWVPPAGSAIAMLYEVGDRESAYYLGTVWNRDRGAPPHNWNYQVPEFQCIHSGHRKGYFVGPNDESQVLPPQNTYNYNIKDFDDLKAFEQDTEALRKVTPSHLHVLKTAQKARLVFDDGNYYCSHRWKHTELASSCGASLLFWDDHLRSAGQHAHPSAAGCGPSAAGSQGGGGVNCGEGDTCPSDPERPPTCETQSDKYINDLFKHESEVRAFRGPCTPQNNKCELRQSGVFLSSISGGVFVQDDEVEEPQGTPDWERGTRPFDFGCTDKFLGKTYIKSATGHMIKLGDAEDQTGIRSGTFKHPQTGEYEPNGITLKTAAGHLIEMNDHTLPGGIAGEKRYIKFQSTSTHLFEMVDYTNQQEGPTRREGGVPAPEAKQAYVRLRSGYGLQLLMRDDNSQKDTQTQFLELMAPHKDNCHGPHLFRMQEAPPNQPGLVLLRCGGYFYGQSLREWIEVVGCPEPDAAGCCPKASKITKVTEHDIHDTDQYYVYLSDIEFHHAKQFIILGAGCDCPSPDYNPRCGGDLGPCIYPVVVGKCPWACPFTGQIHWGVESLSERVFASADKECP